MEFDSTDLDRIWAAAFSMADSREPDDIGRALVKATIAYGLNRAVLESEDGMRAFMNGAASPITLRLIRSGGHERLLMDIPDEVTDVIESRIAERTGRPAE